MATKQVVNVRLIKGLGCLVAVFSLTGISGCPNSKTIAGRYVGELTEGEATHHVVAQIPPFVRVKESKIIRFKTFPILSSADGSEFKVAVSKNGVTLSSEKLGRGEVLLKKNGNCATSAPGQVFAVKLCWSPGFFDLEAKERDQLIVGLHLKREDSELPVPTKREARIYSLDELMGRAKYVGYATTQEAERVYQAKERIAEARGNLLPKLSIRSIVGIVGAAVSGGTSLLSIDFVGVIGDVLPFLFPSNWFRFEASKDLFQAERMSFASLRGNEMSAVEGLYHLILRDQALLVQLDQQIRWMEETKMALLQEEGAQTLMKGSADQFELAINPLRIDRIALNSLIQMEYAQLSQAVALPALAGISGLVPEGAPELSAVSPIDANSFYKEAQEKSYEAKALDRMVDANRYQEKDVFFQFLNPEGGSIGFGTAASFNIARSKRDELIKRREEMVSLVETRSSQVATEYNAALNSFSVAQKAIATTEAQLQLLKLRHMNQDPSLDHSQYVDGLSSLQLKQIEFNADLLSASHGWMMARAKVQRLLLDGPYKNLEDCMPQDKATLKQYELERRE